jgi:hypothetical protein
MNETFLMSVPNNHQWKCKNKSLYDAGGVSPAFSNHCNLLTNWHMPTYIYTLLWSQEKNVSKKKRWNRIRVKNPLK